MLVITGAEELAEPVVEVDDPSGTAATHPNIVPAARLSLAAELCASTLNAADSSMNRVEENKRNKCLSPARDFMKLLREVAMFQVVSCMGRYHDIG
jgi:hypothetical protein